MTDVDITSLIVDSYTPSSCMSSSLAGCHRLNDGRDLACQKMFGINVSQSLVCDSNFYSFNPLIPTVAILVQL